MTAMELAAREALTRRRRALAERHAPPAGAPDARWTDYEATPPEVARREIEEIDAALRRMGEGRYGLCEACTGPIGLQRLRAIPEARYCLACADRRSREQV